MRERIPEQPAAEVGPERGAGAGLELLALELVERADEAFLVHALRDGPGLVDARVAGLLRKPPAQLRVEVGGKHVGRVEMRERVLEDRRVRDPVPDVAFNVESIVPDSLNAPSVRTERATWSRP